MVEENKFWFKKKKRPARDLRPVLLTKGCHTRVKLMNSKPFAVEFL